MNKPTLIERVMPRVKPALVFSPVIGAIFYLDILSFYTRYLQASIVAPDASTAIISGVAAGLLLLVVFSVPLSAIGMLLVFRGTERLKSPSTRRVLYLVVSVPALGGPIWHALDALSLIQWFRPFWFAFWILLGGFLLLPRKPHSYLVQEQPAKAWLRVTHGIAASGVLLSFLFFHLANHLGALWSVDLHHDILAVLRAWYLSKWVEPLLLAFIVLTLCSGAAMMIHYTRFINDKFRTFQIAAGVYLAAFFASHVPTVLKSRAANIETDWFFAVSEAGLLDQSRSMLTAYYILALLALFVHLCLALRRILLAHHMDESSANQGFNYALGIGLLVSALITAAMFGVHISEMR